MGRDGPGPAYACKARILLLSPLTRVNFTGKYKYIHIQYSVFILVLPVNYFPVTNAHLLYSITSVFLIDDAVNFLSHVFLFVLLKKSRIISIIYLLVSCFII